MPNIQHDAVAEHQRSVEDVEEGFVRIEVFAWVLGDVPSLQDAEDITDYDEGA